MVKILWYYFSYVYHENVIVFDDLKAIGRRSNVVRIIVIIVNLVRFYGKIVVRRLKHYCPLPFDKGSAVDRLKYLKCCQDLIFCPLIERCPLGRVSLYWINYRPADVHVGRTWLVVTRRSRAYIIQFEIIIMLPTYAPRWLYVRRPAYALRDEKNRPPRRMGGWVAGMSAAKWVTVSPAETGSPRVGIAIRNRITGSHVGSAADGVVATPFRACLRLNDARASLVVPARDDYRSLPMRPCPPPPPPPVHASHAHFTQRFRKRFAAVTADQTSILYIYIYYYIRRILRGYIQIYVTNIYF